MTRPSQVPTWTKPRIVDLSCRLELEVLERRHYLGGTLDVLGFMAFGSSLAFLNWDVFQSSLDAGMSPAFRRPGSRAGSETADDAWLTDTSRIAIVAADPPEPHVETVAPFPFPKPDSALAAGWLGDPLADPLGRAAPAGRHSASAVPNEPRVDDAGGIGGGTAPGSPGGAAAAVTFGSVDSAFLGMAAPSGFVNPSAFAAAPAGVELPAAEAAPPGAPSLEEFSKRYNEMPLRFEANQGQTDDRVKFFTRGPGYTMFLTATDAVLSLTKPTPPPSRPEFADRHDPRRLPPDPAPVEGHVVRLRWEGANPDAEVVGLNRQPGISNYFIGNDSSKWVSHVPSFGQVGYRDIYPGIDLLYYGNQSPDRKGADVEYDFIVSPGADPAAIRLSVEGSDGVSVDDQGNLIVHTSVGDLVQRAPVVYQEVDAVRRPVAGGYRVGGGDHVAFELGAFDSTSTLIIDPTLSFSTFLGGTHSDIGYDIASDGGGVYVIGVTLSTTFPTTIGAFQSSAVGIDAFITKLDLDGTGLAYSTYLGGAADDYAVGLSLDLTGHVYVSGHTYSTAFPTTANAFQTATSGSVDAFVTKLDTNGSALCYSSYLGGNGADFGTSIAVDIDQQAHVTGLTLSSNFPTTAGAFQTGMKGESDAFVTKFTTDGTGVSYSSFLGGMAPGDDHEIANGIAVDSDGHAYVAGRTHSSDFPVTTGSFQTSLKGMSDAFVTKLSSDGTTLAYSTYLGGQANGLLGNSSGANGIAIDSSQNAYVTGFTESSSFPTTASAFQTALKGGYDVFVTKLNSNGISLSYSTYLGGTSNVQEGFGIAVDVEGSTYVTGDTMSSNFPTTAGAFQTSKKGTWDAFVTKLNATGVSLLYSSFLGSSGTNDDHGAAVATDAIGNAYLTGRTSYSDFPTTSGVFQSSFNGGINDAFVTKLSGSGLTGFARSCDTSQNQIVILSPAEICPQTGNPSVNVPLDYRRTTTSASLDAAAALAGTPALVYDGDTVNVRPIVETIFQSDGAFAVPSSIQAQLTWDGNTQSAVTFGTSGHSAGDAYLLSLQVTSPLTETKPYPWTVDVAATLPDSSVINLTSSGTTFVVVNDSSSSPNPLGDGWSVVGLDRLYVDTSGIWRIYGSGGTRFFQKGIAANTYISPPNDFGTLVKNPGDNTYTYTDKHQTKWNFNTSGRLTTIVDPHNLRVTYSYSAGNPSTVATPDGGLTTFEYSSGYLSRVAEPGNRAVTVNVDGSGRLTTVTDAAGSLRTFAYDSQNRMTNDRWGSWNTTFTYDSNNGALSGIDRGLGNTLAVVPANVQGLATNPAKLASDAVAKLTDGLSRVTTYTLDTAGRLTKLARPGIPAETWERNLSGQVTAHTDPRGNTTYNYYDSGCCNGAGDLTRTDFPDGGNQQYQYHSTFHYLTQLKDNLGRYTTFTYDGTYGDLLSSRDALDQRTTYTWSNGLLREVENARNYRTTYQYFASDPRRLEEFKDALLGRTTYSYDAAGNVSTTTDPLSRVTSTVYDGLRRLVTQTNPAGGLATLTYNPQGQITSETNERNVTTSYLYDAHGWVTVVVEAAGKTEERRTTTLYDAVGNITQVTDARGNATQYLYDALDRPTVTIDALTNRVTTLYDAAGNITGVKDTQAGVERLTSYAYDSMNRRVEMTEAAHLPVTNTLRRMTTYLYDAAGNLTVLITPQAGSLNNRTTFLYDALDRPTVTIDPLTGRVTTLYDAVGNVTGVKDKATSGGAERLTSFAYDALDRQIEMTEAAHLSTAPRRITTYVYDAVGNLTVQIAPQVGSINNRTTFLYDALDQPTVTIDALTNRVTTLYDAVGNITGVEDKQNPSDSVARLTTFSYDFLDQSTGMTEAAHLPVTNTLHRKTTYVYDAVGNLTVVVAPQVDTQNNRTTFLYDALNRHTATIDALTNRTTALYDGVGNLTGTRDQMDRLTSFAYDALDRRIETTEAAGTSLARLSTILYDAADNITGTKSPAVDAGGVRLTTFLYDALHRRLEVTEAAHLPTTYLDRRTTTTLYDLAGNLTAVIDPVGNQTQYLYDDLDRGTVTIDPRSKRTTVLYDAADNVSAVTDRNSRTRNFVYDALHRLTSEIWLDRFGSPLSTFTYSYNNQGDTTGASDPAATYGFKYDALGRATEIANAGSPSSVPLLTLSADFDVQDRRTDLGGLLNGNSELVNTYEYDALGRMTHLNQYLSGVSTYKDAAFTYKPDGQMESIRRRSGPSSELVSTTYDTYDDLARPRQITHHLSTTQVFARHTMTYDAGDRLTQFQSPDGTTTYAYDSIDQLATATHSYQTNEGYSYDKNGNRTNSGYVTDTGNRLTDDGTFTYTYDSEGNRTGRTRKSDGEVTTYDWDYRNRLTHVVEKLSGVTQMEATYTYDAFDRRIAKSVKRPKYINPVTTQYAYDGDHIALVFSGATSTAPVTHRYVYGPGIDQLLVDEVDSGSGPGTNSWALSDQLGTVRDWVDDSGASLGHFSYDSYGQFTSGTPANDATAFTGREWDEETGDYFYRSRYYDVTIGRFTSEDPLGLVPDVNPYRYVGNSPTNGTDPWGLWDFNWDLVKKVISTELQIAAAFMAPQNAHRLPISRGIQEGVANDIKGIASHVEHRLEVIQRAAAQAGPGASPGFIIYALARDDVQTAATAGRNAVQFVVDLPENVNRTIDAFEQDPNRVGGLVFYQGAKTALVAHQVGAGILTRDALTTTASGGRFAAIREALSDANGALLSKAEREGIKFTIRRVEDLGYEVGGAVRYRGHQGIDLWFRGTEENAGRIALAEAKSSEGLGSLVRDTQGIRQGSFDFFATRLQRGGRLDLLQELQAGNADLFGGFSGSGRLFQFDPRLFRRDVNFRTIPEAAKPVP